MRATEAGKLLGVSASAVRKYVNEGRLNCSYNPAGQRVFSQKDIDDFLGRNEVEERIAFYVRDSGGNTELINSQIDKLTEAYGSPVKVFKDKSSGLNENRKGLLKALESAKNDEFNRLAVVAKDRLTRFGFTYLEILFEDRGVEIIVLDDEREKSLQEELMADFMNLLASFSGKFYKMRSIEHKKLLLDRAKENLNKSDEK